MNPALDPRPLFLRALDQLEKLVSRLDPALLDRPTPCTEFDLRALLGHCVGAVHRSAYIGEGGRALDVAAAVGAVADDDWANAVGCVKSRFAAAWADDAKLDVEVEVPWDRMPGRHALGAYVMEVVAHTWDVAQVIDPAAELDAELGEFALGLALRILPAEGREGFPFGQVTEVPDDADVHVRLAGWLGRAV